MEISKIFYTKNRPTASPAVWHCQGIEGSRCRNRGGRGSKPPELDDQVSRVGIGDESREGASVAEVPQLSGFSRFFLSLKIQLTGR